MFKSVKIHLDLEIIFYGAGYSCQHSGSGPGFNAQQSWGSPPEFNKRAIENALVVLNTHFNQICPITKLKTEKGIDGTGTSQLPCSIKGLLLFVLG